jgi:hypothetical protein
MFTARRLSEVCLSDPLRSSDCLWVTTSWEAASVTPKFLISIISANDRINRVKHCWHWSNLGQPETSPWKPRQQSLMTPLIKSTHPFWSNLGERCGQTLVKPHCPWTPAGTFAAFFKFQQNTSNSPNIKLSSFARDTTLLLGGISNFECKRVKNLVNCSKHYSSASWKTSNFAYILCSNHWAKHRTTFVRVVEGSLLYNFAIYTL